METIKALGEIISAYKGSPVEVTENTTFDDLGFDSLDKVDLVMQVEEKFGITLSEDLMVTTVGELAAEIDKLKA